MDFESRRGHQHRRKEKGRLELRESTAVHSCVDENNRPFRRPIIIPSKVFRNIQLRYFLMLFYQISKYANPMNLSPVQGLLIALSFSIAAWILIALVSYKILS